MAAELAAARADRSPLPVERAGFATERALDELTTAPVGDPPPVDMIVNAANAAASTGHADGMGGIRNDARRGLCWNAQAGRWEKGRMMKRLYVFLGVTGLSVLYSPPVVLADQPPARTFVAVLSAGEEVPPCAPATNAARGVAVFRVIDETAGVVEFTLVANNLPGDVAAAHIHIAPAGVAGPVVQPLPPTPGAENGVVAEGTFTNAALVAAIQANPDGYYVNVHTGPPGVGCPSGVIRGQLGDRGPLNQ
jgi:hypothetical protein